MPVQPRYVFFAVFACAGAIACEGCRGREGGFSTHVQALERCDFGPACAKAIEEIKALPAKVLESPEGKRLRHLMLQVMLQAASAFPPLTGTFPVSSAAELANEAHVLGEPVAEMIARFLVEPGCENLTRLFDIEGGTPFSTIAWMAGMQALAQPLAAITPDRAYAFAEAARHLVGCTLPSRAPLDSSLVQARKLLRDAWARCDEMSRASSLARSSCEAVREVLQERDLPLPWPDASAGDLLYATPPLAMRNFGIRITPPFGFVLVAGRLGVYFQPVLPPGRYGSPETKLEWLLDLRQRYHHQDIFMSIKEVLDRNKPVSIGDASAVFLVVDKATPASELIKVLESFLAATDAIVAMALVLRGQADPIFMPVNYFKDRILLDPTGQPVAFGNEEPLVVRLTPFTAELLFGNRSTMVEHQGPQTEDFRPLYRAAASLVGDKSVSAILQVSDAVPVTLLATSMQALSFRMGEESLANAASFKSSAPRRQPNGRPDFLCRVIVVQAWRE